MYMIPCKNVEFWQGICLCIKHGTNLVGANPATGFTASVVNHSCNQ